VRQYSEKAEVLTRLMSVRDDLQALKNSYTDFNKKNGIL